MAIVLPHHFKDGVGEIASGVQVLENDEALKTAIEAIEAGLPKLNGAPLHSAWEFKTFTSEPTIGVSAAFSYTETGIAFPTACLAAWLGGWQAFSDAGHTASGATFFTAAVAPSGKNVQITTANQSGGTLFPRIYVVAIGY